MHHNFRNHRKLPNLRRNNLHQYSNGPVSHFELPVSMSVTMRFGDIENVDFSVKRELGGHLLETTEVLFGMLHTF
ncbi:hypothetical protein Y032_0049g1830 [Ancylostoma ceylanicum]|uniref:Uncharacterized protein n=1 Tax=Ancylostoma ceylanicum TaxID=53326 RepID=A0A016UAL2_9BILA|nr:hypothetical protein Y032_0049g1830 [Ancylostoma ceylanicum]